MSCNFIDYKPINGILLRFLYQIRQPICDLSEVVRDIGRGGNRDI